MIVLFNFLHSPAAGPRFARSSISNMCETSVLFSPSAAPKKVEHTARGCRVCGDVCRQYSDTVRQEHCAAAEVTWLHSHCQMHGAIDQLTGELENMGSSCECLYKVHLPGGGGGRIEFPRYKFEANQVGDMRVSVTGCS